MFLRFCAFFFTAALAAGPALCASGEAQKNTYPEHLDQGMPVVIFNRTIIAFRAPFLGIPAEKRAARARAAINEELRNAEDLTVTIKTDPEGQLVMLGNTLAFLVTDADVDTLRNETAEQAAKLAAERLTQVIAETREARNPSSLLKSAIAAVSATLVFALALWGLSRLRNWVNRITIRIAEHQVQMLKVGDTPIVEMHHLLPFVQKLFLLLRWLIISLLSYEWLSFMLSRFPYTRPWGERLNDYLVSVASSIGGAIISAVPGLGIAFAIFLVARFTISFLAGLLERLSHREHTTTWLGPDTMPTTRRLFNIGIWLFALAMAYPYLPGAHTDAFKGVSVMVGLMVSLGASSIIGQGAAGLILTYTRTMRAGEFVRVSDHEGTVIRVGMFTTTIRTGLGEELTLPNSMITGTVTKNYSRTVKGSGFIVDTLVTIGYDTPWRQVEAMLIEAARRTKGILDKPAPRVFQTALSDYYPEYRLVAQAVLDEPRPRAEVMSILHANIQDVFNEYGVQIMSPHYMMDPASEKIVKPEDWHRAPAKK
jgi:small-conductance mechanosensitive channel